MQGVKFSALVAYFRKLATEHVEIRHSETDKHFYRFELEEILMGLNNVKYPAMILEGYKFDYTDNKSDNPVKNRQGAFVLMDVVNDPGDYDKIHDLWDRMEEIGDDILARIKADKRNPGSPVRDFDLSSVDGSLIASEIAGHYGIRFTFTINCRYNFNVNPDRWIVG